MVHVSRAMLSSLDVCSTGVWGMGKWTWSWSKSVVVCVCVKERFAMSRPSTVHGGRQDQRKAHSLDEDWSGVIAQWKQKRNERPVDLPPQEKSAPLYKHFVPHRPEYTDFQNEELRIRINDQVVSTMQQVCMNEGQAYLKELNRRQFFPQAHNQQRALIYCFQRARKILDVKRVAEQEQQKMDQLPKATVARAPTPADEDYAKWVAQEDKRKHVHDPTSPESDPFAWPISNRRFISIKQLVHDRQESTVAPTTRAGRRTGPDRSSIPSMPSTEPTHTNKELLTQVTKEQNELRQEFLKQLNDGHEKNLQSLFYLYGGGQPVVLNNTARSKRSIRKGLHEPYSYKTQIMVHNRFRAGQLAISANPPAFSINIDSDQFVQQATDKKDGFGACQVPALGMRRLNDNRREMHDSLSLMESEATGNLRLPPAQLLYLRQTLRNHRDTFYRDLEQETSALPPRCATHVIKTGGKDEEEDNDYDNSLYANLVPGKSKKEGFGFRYVPPEHAALMHKFKDWAAASMPPKRGRRYATLDQEQNEALESLLANLGMPPILRIRFLMRLVSGTKSIDRVLDALKSGCAAIHNRELQLQELLSCRKEGSNEKKEIRLTEALVDATHACADLVLDLYKRCDVFLVWQGELYTKKMHQDDVHEHARVGKHLLHVAAEAVMAVHEVQDQAYLHHIMEDKPQQI